MKNPRITIHDLAKELGLSSSTVSRALQDNPRISEKTRKDVTELAAKWNYQPNSNASNLRKGRSNTIGVLVPRISRHFFSNAIAGIEAVSSAAKRNVVIFQSHESLENEKAGLEAFLRIPVDGFIMSLSAETRQYEHIREVLKRDIPIVFFDRVLEEENNYRVVLDDYAGAFQATEHLIRQGCRKIAFMGGPDYLNNYRERKRGFTDALEKNNLSVNPGWMAEQALTREEGAAFVEKIFGQSVQNRPDGLFSCSDYSALGAILFMKKTGIRIPEEVAVAGFANEPFTEFMEPAMTSVDQSAEEMGQSAAEMLFRIIDSGDAEKSAKQQYIQPKLVIRKSTMK
ncbi:LacI family DNA-binding transcriptional regulator [Prolixibacter denitrificans]|uniref:LacI family transcriptional regulator n=1 Tax=Prolixibacter denitrificans TaxID=1541063 RepID=A0A2P8CHY5_9BACT|nr:LacI family DNA-binding transcriptional regulator [Prolixibacter denitrificans]PSK84566.1 LacI family transcriptional regulator [Prolixibacter denitrificans]GET20735.1 LacI family transcriptional regulator [Prolixibacter denitrificans]